jgi:hypothetical protein
MSIQLTQHAQLRWGAKIIQSAIVHGRRSNRADHMVSGFRRAALSDGATARPHRPSGGTRATAAPTLSVPYFICCGPA